MSKLPSAGLPGRPSPEPRPSVTRHVIDWEVSDFSGLTTRQIRDLGDAIQTGCHFLNPLYTVSSPQPTAAFYRKAIWARAGWIKLFKDTIGSRGFHDQSKDLGVSAKQLQISGVMYREGTVLPPPVWKQHAQVALNPELGLITTTRRSVNLADLLTPEGQQALMSLSRADLQRLLSSQPSAALYVTPALTLAAPRLTPTFLAQAREAESQWHRRVNQHLGKFRKTLARSADLPTRMWAFHGVLAANGRIYLPSCWPDKHPSQGKLSQTPFRSPTVPPDFLGLDILG